jgi:hypothetical protein
MSYAASQAESRPEQIVITVAQILEPKGPRKPAWIKSAEGVNFSIWPDKLGQFREGESYEIEYVTTNGYHNIKSARAAARPSPAPAQFTAQHQPARSLSSAASPPPHQAQPQGNGGQYFRPTSPKDARRMFICSQMNALITSHQVQVTAQGIADAIVMLSDAYDATLGREDQ